MFKPNAAREYLFKAYSRVNPVLTPRRRAETAWKHAISSHMIVKGLLTHPETEWTDWSAQHLLDESSILTAPPGWEYVEDLGSARRRAMDYGGVPLRHWDLVAEVIMSQEPCEPRDVIWRSWAHLYPLTAGLGTLEEPLEAVSEWAHDGPLFEGEKADVLRIIRLGQDGKSPSEVMEETGWKQLTVEAGRWYWDELNWLSPEDRQVVQIYRGDCYAGIINLGGS